MKKKIVSLLLILALSACALLFFTACTDDSKKLSFKAEVSFKETHPVERSYQGAAAYGKYFFQFSDHMENVGVYDIDQGSLLCVRSWDMNELYHCNNVNFGVKKYAEEDEFPLLYVSMENIDAHCALVLRVARDGNDFTFTRVQTLVYPDPKESGVYYPNCMIDGENDRVYIMGYTEYSYKKSKSNHIRVTEFALPDYRLATAELKTEEALSSFELDSVTATQGGLVKNGKIYQVYGFKNDITFRILDPKKQCYTAVVKLPKHKFKREPEGLAEYNGDFYCADVSGDVYKFSFTETEE